MGKKDSAEKIKVYTYTRVSTAMQIDGYSLDAQKARMKAYADYNDYEMVNLICVEDGIDSYQHQNSCF